MVFCRHHIAHCAHLMMSLYMRFLSCSDLVALSMALSTIRTVWQSAMMKEPTAIEPECFETIVHVASHRRPVPVPALQHLTPSPGLLSATNQYATAHDIDVHEMALQKLTSHRQTRMQYRHRPYWADVSTAVPYLSSNLVQTSSSSVYMTMKRPVTTKPSWKSSPCIGHTISTGSVRKTLVVSLMMAMQRRIALAHAQISSSVSTLTTIETTAAIWKYAFSSEFAVERSVVLTIVPMSESPTEIELTALLTTLIESNQPLL